MSASDLAAELIDFKAADAMKLREDVSSGAGARLLVDDPDAQKVCAAYAAMEPPRVKRIRRNLGDDPARRWRRLWSRVEVDLVELTLNAGLPWSTTQAKFRVLANARMIFPDGTISRWAKGVLGQEIARPAKG